MDTIGKQIVPYVMIFFAIIILYKVVTLSFSLVIWMIIGLIVARYFYLRQEKTSQANLIREEFSRVPIFRSAIPTKIYAYADIIDFLYGINYYYGINRNAYESLIDNINTFLKLYEEIMHTQMLYCRSNTEVAVGIVMQAENNLQSIIYGLSPVDLANKKFHTELDAFSKLMGKYLNRIVSKCNKGSPNPIDMTAPRASNYDWVVGTAPTSFEYF